MLEEVESTSVEYDVYIYAFGKSYAKSKIQNSEFTDLTYIHYDHLGSTRLMTDVGGNVVFDQDYLPFGGDLSKEDQIAVLNEAEMGYKYTGQNEVASIGLYYYGARYYDPGMGRFITEDTYQGDLFNPQSQNLYLYVMNNPLRFVDPTGHSAEDGIDLSNILDAFRNLVDLFITGKMTLFEDVANIETDAESGFSDTFVDIETGRVINDYATYRLNKELKLSDNNYFTQEEVIEYLSKLLNDPQFEVVLNKLPKDERINVIGLGLSAGTGYVLGGQDGIFAVFDNKGNIGIYNSTEIGYYIGVGATGGPRVLYSRTANDIYDLPGWWAISAGVEFGRGKTLDYGYSVSFSGTSTHTTGISFGELTYYAVCTAMYNPSWLFYSTNIEETEFFQSTIEPLFNIIQSEQIDIHLAN